VRVLRLAATSAGEDCATMGAARAKAETTSRFGIGSWMRMLSDDAG
jgi:hypothetical protein